MKFIFVIFLFFLLFSMISRYFGKFLTRWGIGRFNKWAEKEMEKQSQDYHRQTESGPYNENVYVDEEIKVSVDRKNQKHKKPKLNDLPVEDVDFEELDSGQN